MKSMWFDNREEQQDKPDRQAIRYLQQAQMTYGSYALIPDTNQMYEDAIQALVANDLRWQYERRRRGQHTCAHSEPLRHARKHECVDSRRSCQFFNQIPRS
jgi:hypothetical protein